MYLYLWYKTTGEIRNSSKGCIKYQEDLELMICINIHPDCACNSKHVQRTWEKLCWESKAGSPRAQEKLRGCEEVEQSLHRVLLLPQGPAAFPQLLARGCLTLPWLPQHLEMFL